MNTLYREMIRKIAELERRLERFEAIERIQTGIPADVEVLETYQHPTSDANVSNPPTDAEIDAAFDTPANVGDGYAAFIDDNGAGANLWLVVSDGTNWWYQAFTKAV